MGTCCFVWGCRAREGEERFRAALALYPHEARVYQGLADRYRHAGKCYPAIDLYRKAVALGPDLNDARAAFIACLLYLGDYRAAAAQARLGGGSGGGGKGFYGNPRPA